MKYLNNNFGCFGGSPKPPQASPPPNLAPPPTILPTNVSEVSAQETARKQRLAQLRYGFASTIKTSPKGLVETTPTGKTTTG